MVPKTEPETDVQELPSSSTKVRAWPPLSGSLADTNDEDDEFPLIEVSGVYSDPSMQLCQAPEQAGFAHAFALYSIFLFIFLISFFFGLLIRSVVSI